MRCEEARPVRGRCVVDAGGNPAAFARMDGAQAASITIAEHKARASAEFRRETIE